MNDSTTFRNGTDQIGKKLRHTRRVQKKTLRAIADKIRCSESMLSKIELGRVIPSLDLIARLAEELGITIGALFHEETYLPVVIYNAGERPRIELGSGKGRKGHSTLERLIPYERGRLLNANLHVVPPGGGSNGVLTHKGEEVGFVVEGFIQLTVDGKSSLLGAGSSFFFSSTLPHSYRNIGSSDARIVWVNSPPY